MQRACNKYSQVSRNRSPLAIFTFKNLSNFPKIKKSLNHCPSESIGLKFIPNQSELFRFITILSVSEPMPIIPNQSEKRFVSRLMKNYQKSIQLNPINSDTSIRMNPNQSEKRFVSRLMKNYQKSIQLNPINSDTSIRMNPNQFQTKFSIQINPINPNHSDLGLIRIDSD